MVKSKAFRYKKVAFYTLILLSTYIFTVGYGVNNNKVLIRFYDVGQGDSILIKFPKELNEYKILIDGGPSNILSTKISKDVSFNNKIINSVVITHLHDDHIAGLYDILHNYSIESAFIPSLPINEYKSSPLIKSLLGNNITTITPFHNQIMTISNNNAMDSPATLRFIWSGLDSINATGCANLDTSNPNVYSLVILLTYKDFSALFASDAEAGVLECLENLSDIDILKVPHQGSRDALFKNFYYSTLPEIAILSVGKNTYGHPHKEVLDFLKLNSINTFRTDIYGDISILTDGITYTTFYSKIK